MQSALAAQTLLGTGLRSLPARPARGAGLAPRAASTRLPAGGRGPGAPSAAASSSSGGGYKSDVPPSDVSPGELFSIVTTLGLTGASVGTYLDGIHSRVHVLVYDKLPLIHGGLHTSAIVPPLLAGGLPRVVRRRGGQPLRTEQRNATAAPCVLRPPMRL